VASLCSYEIIMSRVWQCEMKMATSQMTQLPLSLELILVVPVHRSTWHDIAMLMWVICLHNTYLFGRMNLINLTLEKDQCWTVNTLMNLQFL
jgi:hypothetical protein